MSSYELFTKRLQIVYIIKMTISNNDYRKRKEMNKGEKSFQRTTAAR